MNNQEYVRNVLDCINSAYIGLSSVLITSKAGSSLAEEIAVRMSELKSVEKRFREERLGIVKNDKRKVKKVLSYLNKEIQYKQYSSGMVSAVAFVRDETGMALTESKNMVDTIAADNQQTSP